jgi:DNA-binding GntR family transcriptional regulator
LHLWPKLIKLDSVTESAYVRVANDLRRQILDGTLEPGGRLPSQAQIREIYQVSDTVALEARRVLIAEGLAEGRSGSGTYVRVQPVHQRIRRLMAARDVGSAFRAAEASAGRVGDWDSDSVLVEAPEDIADRLGIQPGDRVIRTDYLFRSDGAPAQVSTSWEPYAITGQTAIIWPEAGRYAGKGVIDRMATIGLTVTVEREIVRARAATAREAERLRVPVGAVVLTIERTYRGDDGLAAETCDIVFPADRTELEY